MRGLNLGRVLAVIGFALLLAGPAVAQDKAFVVAGGWAPVYGASTFVPLGLFVNGSFPVASNISILGDVGYQYKSGLSILEATGGVRYWVPVQGKNSVMPFVEGSAGLGYGSYSGASRTEFGWGFGGGVDVPIPNQSVGVRVQVDYYRLFGGNAIRFGVGISGKMGGK